MRFSCGTAVRALINTGINVWGIIYKCSNTSNFRVDFGDNDTRIFSISELFKFYEFNKTYTKTSIFTVNWTMIDINYTMTTQINGINL